MKLKQMTFNPFQENTYVVWCEETKECAIIDCGVLMRGEEARLKSWIAEEGLTVVEVLNTHLHLDHCFGNAWAAVTYGVLPRAHKDDEELLASMEAHAAAYGLTMDVKVQRLGGYLDDNEEVKIGHGMLKVIHTPGHSRGGVCLYAEADGFLLSGDTLFEGSIGRTDLPGGDYGTLIRVVQKRVFVLSDDVMVYPGHGGATSVGQEKRMNPFF